MPLWHAKGSRTHIVGECEMYKEERDVLERKIDECCVEKFNTTDNSYKIIAILGHSWWPQTAKQEGDKVSKLMLCNRWKKRDERPRDGGLYWE